MKAILLAAGFGKRLRPLTNNIPKCLVPINKKPLLEIWIENLVNAGITEILINTHYLSNEVEKYISSSKYRTYCIIKYEKKLLGTAGTLIKNFDFIGNDDCLLIHADNYCKEDLKKFIHSHINRPNYCHFTMMAFRTENPSSSGILELDKNKVVIAFHEKKLNPPGNLANGAVYALSNFFICSLINNNFFVTDFSLEVINKFLGKIYTFETKEVFIDIGTPETYSKANEL